MSLNIDKTAAIALSAYASYHLIKFVTPGDINITLTRDATALLGAAYVVSYYWCPYFTK